MQIMTFIKEWKYSILMKCNTIHIYTFFNKNVIIKNIVLLSSHIDNIYFTLHYINYQLNKMLKHG